MSHNNNKQETSNAQNGAIFYLMLGLLFTVIVFLLARLFPTASADNKPPEIIATVSQTENDTHSVQVKIVAEVESDSKLIDGYLRIVKFSISDALYIVSNHGTYTPLLNEDGTPMTLTQFEEVMPNEGNQE